MVLKSKGVYLQDLSEFLSELFCNTMVGGMAIWVEWRDKGEAKVGFHDDLQCFVVCIIYVA